MSSSRSVNHPVSGSISAAYAVGDAGGDATCDLTVEADLYLVGPEREARAAALVVAGRELTHDAAGRRGVRGRAGGGGGRWARRCAAVGRAEARTAWCRPSGRCRSGSSRNRRPPRRGRGPRSPEGGSEPLGGDVGRAVQEGRPVSAAVSATGIRTGIGPRWRRDYCRGHRRRRSRWAVAALRELLPGAHDRRRPGAGCPGSSGTGGKPGANLSRGTLLPSAGGRPTSKSK